MLIDDLFPSNYLRADDVLQPRVFTMLSLSVEAVGEEKTEKPVLHFAEDSRGLVLNKTNSGIISHSLGKETDNWIRRQLEQRAEPVPFQGRIVNAIRVRVVPQSPEPLSAASAPPSPSVPNHPEPVGGVANVDDDIDV